MKNPIFDMSYDVARCAYYAGQVTAQAVAEWFPLWCEGKGSFRVKDGIPQEWRQDPLCDDGRWFPIYWVLFCMKESTPCTP